LQAHTDQQTAINLFNRLRETFEQECTTFVEDSLQKKFLANVKEYRENATGGATKNFLNELNGLQFESSAASAIKNLIADNPNIFNSEAVWALKNIKFQMSFYGLPKSLFDVDWKTFDKDDTFDAKNLGNILSQKKVHETQLNTLGDELRTLSDNLKSKTQAIVRVPAYELIDKIRALKDLLRALIDSDDAEKIQSLSSALANGVKKFLRLKPNIATQNIFRWVRDIELAAGNINKQTAQDLLDSTTSFSESETRADKIKVELEPLNAEFESLSKEFAEVQKLCDEDIVQADNVRYLIELRKSLGASYADFKKFLILIKRINDDLIDNQIFEVGVRVSRTALMLMHYYLYNLKAISARKPNFTFKDHCANYLRGLNSVLTSCYMKNFDVKSFADVTLLLSS